MKKVLTELKPYIIIVAIVVFIRSFIVTPGLVNGPSMENTLYNNDLVLVNKIGLLGGIKRFDIVVLKYNKDTLIKRVIALPGEKVEYKNNELYINGEKLDTGYVLKDNELYYNGVKVDSNYEIKNDVLYVNGSKALMGYNFEYTNDFTMTAGENEYIVLGDNRDISKDSREIGAVKRKNIKGKVKVLLFPFKRFGLIK